MSPTPIVDAPTAVAGLVGFTSKTIASDGTSLVLAPRPIASLLEFETIFGGPFAEPVTAIVVPDAGAASGFAVREWTPPALVPRFALYWAVKSFFDNGGRSCVVVSTGPFGPAVDPDALVAGISVLADAPEPTLVAVPDAASAASLADYATVTGALLAQCETRRDRFAIVDVWHGELPPDVRGPEGSTVVDASRQAWSDHLSFGAAYYPHLVTDVSQSAATPSAHVTVSVNGATPQSLDVMAAAGHPAARTVADALDARHLVVPPSGAVAGACGAADAARGVWHAPANLPLGGVLAPAVDLTSAQQERLNADPLDGKSINAIRAFAGKGTVIWGARTLAGNDNEWRYVSVRRFFIFIEASVGTSTQWAVFEPNDDRLWTRLRGTIEDYLAQKWRDGALAGATPREAFFVRCGLGTTMTEADVAAGRVIVELGLAVLRPAEFTLLRISHATAQASGQPG